MKQEVDLSVSQSGELDQETGEVCLYADDVLLLASLDHDIPHTGVVCSVKELGRAPAPQI